MFVHLNIHSTYDLLYSSLKINDVVSKAKENRYQALAITDTNVLYGFLSFMTHVLKRELSQYLE